MGSERLTILKRYRASVIEARNLAASGEVEAAFDHYTSAVALSQVLEDLRELALGEAIDDQIHSVFAEFFQGTAQPDPLRLERTLITYSYHETIEHAIQGGLDLDAYLTIEGVKSRRLFHALAVLQAKDHLPEGGRVMGPGDLDRGSLDFILSAGNGRIGVLAFFVSALTGAVHAFTIIQQGESSRCDRWEVLDNRGSSQTLSDLRIYCRIIEAQGPRSAQVALRGLLEKLGVVLQPPIQHLKRHDVDKLIIVPHAWLHLLPLHAVPIDLGGIETLPISLFSSVVFVPSLRMYSMVMTDKDMSKWTWEVVGCFDVENLPFGVATFLYFDYTHRGGKRRLLVNPSLAIARDHVAGKTLVHWDCHGQASEANFMESSLLLAEGVLSFREILDRLSFDGAQLVFLNACSTGVSFNPELLSDEYYGLDGAVLAKGALNVVSTLATVYDDAAFLLGWRTYINLHELNMDISTALQGAQLWLRDGAWKECEKLRLMLQVLEVVAREGDTYLARKAQKCWEYLSQIIRNYPADYFRDEIFWAQWKCSGSGSNVVPLSAIEYSPWVPDSQ